MKTPILFAAAVALPLCSPVMADDTAAGFHALSNLSGSTDKVIAMTEQQLSAVDGASRRYRGRGGDVCIACSNAAKVRQANASVLSALVSQSNAAAVFQSNN